MGGTLPFAWRKSDGNGQPSLQNTITVHIDITSEGTLRKVDVNELIKLKVHDSPDNLEEPAKMVHGGDDSEDGTSANEYEYSPKYWTDLERAMELFETALDPPEWKGRIGDEGEGEEDDDTGDKGATSFRRGKYWKSVPDSTLFLPSDSSVRPSLVERVKSSCPITAAKA